LGEAQAEYRTFYPVLGEGERPSGAKAQRPLEYNLNILTKFIFGGRSS
jgi:hypothetical protein